MPDWRHDISARLAGLKLEPCREAEIVEELSQHLEDRYRETLPGGAGDEEAQRQVLAELSVSNLLERELQAVEAGIRNEPMVPRSLG